MISLLRTALGPLFRVPAFESVGPAWETQHPTTVVPAADDTDASVAHAAHPSAPAHGRTGGRAHTCCEHVERLEADNDRLRTEVLRLEAAAIGPHAPVWEAS